MKYLRKIQTFSIKMCLKECALIIHMLPIINKDRIGQAIVPCQPNRVLKLMGNFAAQPQSVSVIINPSKILHGFILRNYSVIFIFLNQEVSKSGMASLTQSLPNWLGSCLAQLDCQSCVGYSQQFWEKLAAWSSRLKFSASWLYMISFYFTTWNQFLFLPTLHSNKIAG